MDLSYLLSKNFLFTAVPPVKSDMYVPLLIFFGLIILFAVGLLFLRKWEEGKIVSAFVSPFVLTGTLGLLHLFARYEGLPWIASPFFLVIVFTIFLVWTITTGIIANKRLSDFRKKTTIEERFNKYLPISRKSKR